MTRLVNLVRLSFINSLLDPVDESFSSPDNVVKLISGSRAQVYGQYVHALDMVSGVAGSRSGSF
jgi:hypothetical protein